MRSKAPLVLMEQVIMVLVFALAAAVCVRMFALSEQISKASAEQNQATLAAQNAAEIMKNCRGDGEKAASLGGGTWTTGDTDSDGVWEINYDANWTRTESSSVYCLKTTIQPDETSSESAFLGSAEVQVCDAESEQIAHLTVKWQTEVKQDA